MALRLAAEEGLSRSGKACKGRGVEEVFGEGDMASMRIRKLRIGEATEPPFCTVCVACMIHVTLSSPLFFFPALPFSFTLLLLFLLTSLLLPFPVWLSTRSGSHFKSVRCDLPSFLPLPHPSLSHRWVHLQIACNKFLPVCHKTLKTICAK